MKPPLRPVYLNIRTDPVAAKQHARRFDEQVTAVRATARIPIRMVRADSEQSAIPASAVVDYDGDHDHGDDNFGGNVMAGPPPYARLSVFKWFGTI